MPGLEFEMIYRLKVRGPHPWTMGSPRGERVYWEMAEATLEGKRIKARSAMPGIDWFAPGWMVLGGRMCGCNSSPTTRRSCSCTTPVSWK